MKGLSLSALSYQEGYAIGGPVAYAVGAYRQVFPLLKLNSNKITILFLCTWEKE